MTLALTAGALIAAIALALASAACLQGGIARRVVAFQGANAIAASLSVLLAAALGEPAYLDIAIAALLAGLIGTLTIARFLERWL